MQWKRCLPRYRRNGEERRVELKLAAYRTSENVKYKLAASRQFSYFHYLPCTVLVNYSSSREDFIDHKDTFRRIFSIDDVERILDGVERILDGVERSR